MSVLDPSFGYIGIAVLAVLWNYSVLPKVDWRLITAGVMSLLTADAIAATAGTTLMNLGSLGVLGNVLALIGAILVVIGALQNALANFK